ncbi:N-6 DNA methylase, partial [Candidatus Poribacteria bacterium]|nr:N-6 DNA methylase [Candidatus Poribacteria bacterium]
MPTMDEVLLQAGFAESSHLITPDSLSEPDAVEQRYRYEAIFKHSDDAPDAIYEIGGIPQIYFKGLNEPSSEQFAQIHRFAWNRGDAPLLWVITPSHVRVYNAYSRPTDGDDEKHLIDLLEDINQHLEIYHRESFDTGQFWQTPKAAKVRAQERVDQGLLSDIQGTTDQLRKNGSLALNVAHALVGRTIFLAYLHDRGLLPTEFEELTEVFKDADYAMRSFAWLKDTFNGDLFPISESESETVREEHVKILQQFLSGTDMQSGQLRFWPYKFDVIPIELISSIYEMFAHDEDPDKAKAASVHYTPPFLVNMMLSEAMKNLDSQAIVLDPACGSGVFLVEAFKRLAYLRSHERRQAIEANELKEILTSQIYGIELSREAAKITAFSLYLALLELQPDLNASLDFRLPHLLNRTIFVGNTFDSNAQFNSVSAFKEKRFNLVIGNPPWTSWKDKQELGIEYCRLNNLPLAHRKPYQAFIWRIRDFVSDTAEICLLVHASMLFLQGGTSKSFRQAFLREFTLRAVINLADFRKLRIFKEVAVAAAILFFRTQPAEGHENITYCCPKWTLNFRITRQFMLNTDDVVSFPVSTPQQFESIWKTAFWGKPRDYALIRKLGEFDTLERFLKEEGFDENKRGLGYKKGTKGSKVFSSEHYGKPWLRSKQMLHSYRLPSDLPEFYPEGRFDSTRRDEIYQGPLVIICRTIRTHVFAQRRSFLVAGFFPSDLVYDGQYYGIAIAPKPDAYGHYLSAVLNSKIAAYFQLMTSSSWGVDRNVVEPNDLLRTPIPLLSEVPPNLLNQILKKSRWLYENIDKATDAKIAEHQSALDGLIYQLYDLTRDEQELVEDTLSLTVDFFQKRGESVALCPPSTGELKESVEALIGVLNAYLKIIGKQFSATVFNTPKSPLRVVKLSYGEANALRDEVQIRSIDRLDTVLNELADNLRS